MFLTRMLPFLLIASAALAQGTGNQPSPASKMYCCTDPNSGARVCGDTLPLVCQRGAYREVTPSGRTIKEVLTPEQQAVRDAELKAQQEKLLREAEAKRRDRVLLDSYATVSEIDARRDREVSNLEGDLKRAQAREAELLVVREKLEKLKPASGPIPRDVVEDLETNMAELISIRTVMASKERDIDAVRARFQADRDRYIVLKAAVGR